MSRPAADGGAEEGYYFTWMKMDRDSLKKLLKIQEYLYLHVQKEIINT
jgi:hypothetical protein